MAWYLPFLLLLTILAIYQLAVFGIDYFKLQENGKGIRCLFLILILLIYGYYQIITKVLFDGLSNINLHF
jgi:hypothetical protein